MKFHRNVFLLSEIDQVDGKKMTQQIICALHSKISQKSFEAENMQWNEDRRGCNANRLRAWVKEESEPIKNSILRMRKKKKCRWANEQIRRTCSFVQCCNWFFGTANVFTVKCIKERREKKLNTCHLNFYICCQDEYFLWSKAFLMYTYWIQSAYCIFFLIGRATFFAAPFSLLFFICYCSVRQCWNNFCFRPLKISLKLRLCKCLQNVSNQFMVVLLFVQWKEMHWVCNRRCTATNDKRQTYEVENKTNAGMNAKINSNWKW